MTTISPNGGRQAAVSFNQPKPIQKIDISDAKVSNEKKPLASLISDLRTGDIFEYNAPKGRTPKNLDTYGGPAKEKWKSGTYLVALGTGNGSGINVINLTPGANPAEAKKSHYGNSMTPGNAKGTAQIVGTLDITA